MLLTSRTGIFGAAFCLLALAAIPAQGGDNGWNLSIGANGQASAKDVGLPFYPGARPRKDKDDGDSAAHVWALLGGAGLKVAVMKLESNDAPGRIAAFYRPALLKYGPILDCTGRSSGMRVEDKNSDKLVCDNDKPKPGELLFKAGRNRDQHIVAIRPRGHGSEIDLVFVQVKGLD